MKYYIIIVVIIVGVIVLKPWNLFSDCQPLTQIDININHDSDEPIPIHNLIRNHFSNLDETIKLDQTVERFMNQWEIKGASLAIMKDGKLIYSKGYGYANEEEHIKMDVDHIFRIASISKLITAIGVMKLIEQGNLSLEDRVFGESGVLNDSIFLEFKDKRHEEITIEHLLRHQGGFSSRYTDPMFNPIEVAQFMEVDAPADLDAIIRYVLTKRLGFRPGSSTKYSNIGYGILSKIIEKISGQSYETFIQDTILTPIGCYDMHLGYNTYEKHFPNEVKYYEPSSAEMVPICNGNGEYVLRSNGGNNIEALCGAGGWVASPTELLRLLSAIDNDSTSFKILSSESIELMTDSSAPRLPVGWMYTNSKGDWWRSGTLAGTSAMMKRQSDGFSWVFVTNTSSWMGSRFPKKIETMIQQAMNRVKTWPERDLFNPDYCREMEEFYEFLTNEPNVPTAIYHISPSI